MSIFSYSFGPKSKKVPNASNINNLDNDGYPIKINGICNIFYQFTNNNTKPDNIAWTNNGLFICEDNSISTVITNDTKNKIWHLIKLINIIY